MCNEFLNFFDQKTQDWPMHLDISYSKICDWTICVTKRGCAKGYPRCVCDGDDVVLVRVQDPDKEFCFAKAYVELKEWFLKYKGGILKFIRWWRKTAIFLSYKPNLVSDI